MNEWLLENSNAFNSGVGVARLAEQRRESDLDRDVRIQELKSQDALRRLTEAHLAQQMSRELQKHNEEIQMKADAAKATAQFQLLNSPVIPIPMGTNGQTVLAPNPLKAPSSGHAFIQAYAPLARNPKEASDIASTGTMMTMRDANAEYLSQRPDIEANKELGRNFRSDLSNQTKLTLEDMRGQWHQDVAHINADAAWKRLKEKLAMDSSSGKLPPSVAAHYRDDLIPQEKRLTVALNSAEKRHAEAEKSFDKARIATTTRELRKAQQDYDEGIQRITEETHNRMIELSIKGAKAGDDATPPQKLDEPGAMINPPASSERVRVKSKDGKLFTLPASQLDEAVSQGYTVVK